MEATSKNQEKSNLSLKMEQDITFHGVSNQTDLQNGNADNNGGETQTPELQLSLGLSMNGTFGVDPACRKLKRSSSISNLTVYGAVEVARDDHSPLVRASSVPIENEDEVRRRKADQSARRLEVRRKINWKKSARGIKENGFEKSDRVVKQGSVVLQKNAGSSGVSDQQIEGATQNGEEKSPSSVQSGQVEQAPPVRANNAPHRNGRRNNGLVSTRLLDMPYVSTRGVGNKIKGFLYKYEKGDDVKIVCVCHGLFLSPAEFVRHGGGGDVENPLQHIIVNTAKLF